MGPSDHGDRMLTSVLLATLMLLGTALAASALPHAAWPDTTPARWRWLEVRLQPLSHALARTPALQPAARLLAPAAGRMAAGGWVPWSGWTWLACSLVLSSAAGLVAGLLWGVAAAAIAAVVAAVTPGWLLLARAREQERRLTHEIPDWLDGMALIVGAGMDFRSALRRYAQASPQTALAPYLQAFLADVQGGMRNVDAVERLASTLALARFDGLFLSLRTALVSGLPLAEFLRRHAETERSRRFELAEQRAAEAAVKLTGPLMLIFLALMLLLVGPLIFVGGGVAS